MNDSQPTVKGIGQGRGSGLWLLSMVMQALLLIHIRLERGQPLCSSRDRVAFQRVKA